jgi:hypothetical protein
MFFLESSVDHSCSQTLYKRVRKARSGSKNKHNIDSQLVKKRSRFKRLDIRYMRSCNRGVEPKKQIFLSASVGTNRFNDVAIITRRRIISSARWSDGWRSGRPRDVAIRLIAIIRGRGVRRTFRTAPVNRSQHVSLSNLTASILTCIGKLENRLLYEDTQEHSASAVSQDDDIQGNRYTPK